MEDSLLKLNQRSIELLDSLTDWVELGRIGHQELESGAIIYDFGINHAGGLESGCRFAQLLMGDLARVHVIPWDAGSSSSAAISVTTDFPLESCIGAQYAGWPVQAEKFFAMGSGPMRSVRGEEKILKKYDLVRAEPTIFGGLETDQIPTEEVIDVITEACGVSYPSVVLGVAPVTSLAGTVQVVARSVETSLHKLDELGFDLRQVKSAHGTAPIPPCATSTISGIGRTNDSILYGAQVTLWVDCDDDWIEQYGAKVPSNSSSAYGAPFADIFKQHDNDFYKIDPALFSPAFVRLINLRSGRQFAFGELRDDLLAKSFA